LQAVAAPAAADAAAAAVRARLVLRRRRTGFLSDVEQPPWEGRLSSPLIDQARKLPFFANVPACSSPSVSSQPVLLVAKLLLLVAKSRELHSLYSLRSVPSFLLSGSMLALNARGPEFKNPTVCGCFSASFLKTL